MGPDVLYIPKNESLGDPLPGDFILTHNNDWVSALIRFGQACRFRGSDRKYTYWNHAALIVGVEGELVEAISNGVKKTHLSKYLPKEYVVVRVEATNEDRIQMIHFAQTVLNRGYGFLTFLSLGLSLLTGLKFNFGVEGELVCSGLVAHAMFKGDDNFERPLNHITPADLAKHYDIAGRGD